MAINKNTLPVLYTVAMISGFSNLAVLANRPAPVCNIERDDIGNPVRVIGTVDYSGFGSTLSLILSGITIAGAGTLLSKHLKGEEVEETINTPNPHSVLMPSSTPTFDSMTEGLSHQAIPEEIMIDNSPSPILQDGPLTINLNKQEKKVDKPTRNIVQEIASSHQSTVIVAEPGCGKSTLEKAVLSRLIQTHSQWDIYIVGMKNDSWMGLSQDKEKFCFYQDDPEELMEIMESVHNELLRRLGTPEDERTFDNQPLVLLLDDFPAICSSLKGTPCLDRLKRILAKILTTGREVFVVAHVITQTFNVTTLGLDDANIRGSMNLIALIKSNKDDSGRNDGGVGTATRMICNQSIIGDNNQRQDMLNRLPKLVKQTEETGLPAMVAIAGTTPYMGMLPNLKGAEVKVNVIKKTKPEPSYQPDNTETEIDTEKAVEMLNRAVKIDTSDYDLYQYICDLAKEGKNQTYIIKEVLQKPGRNYQDGRAELRKLQDKYGDIPFKQN